MTKVKKYKKKTHKGARKRMKVTKSGRVRRNRSGAGHLLSAKSGKRRRHLRRAAYVHVTMESKYREELGG